MYFRNEESAYEALVDHRSEIILYSIDIAEILIPLIKSGKHNQIYILGTTNIDPGESILELGQD